MALNLNVNQESVALKVLQNLDRRREEGDYDFTIIVEGHQIRAEKNVLMSGSDYFKAMLQTEMTEKISGEVRMQDADFESVNTCINYIYGREVFVKAENFGNLMRVADMFELTGLCDAIEKKMAETLEISQYFVTLNIATLFNRTILMNECKKFATINFEALSKEEDFNSVPKAFLKELIMSQNVHATEETKFDIILNWVKFAEERNQELYDLIQCIDFTQIPIGFGRRYVAMEPLINQNNECLVYVSLALLASVAERATYPRYHMVEPYSISPLHPLRSILSPHEEPELDGIDEGLANEPFHQQIVFPHQPRELPELNPVPDVIYMFQPLPPWRARADGIGPMNSNPFLPPH